MGKGEGEGAKDALGQSVSQVNAKTLFHEGSSAFQSLKRSRGIPLEECGLCFGSRQNWLVASSTHPQTGFNPDLQSRGYLEPPSNPLQQGV